MSFGKWLLEFLLIAAGIGVLAFFVGEMLPRRWFNPDAFPYRCAKWEQGGAFYEKLRIRYWKDIFPDMSRFIPQTFRKKAGLSRDPEHAARLIVETCSAEAVHWGLMLVSLLYPIVMGPAGWICYFLYNLLGNVPPILIQRYNRPRLQKMLTMMRARAAKRPREEDA